MIDPKRAMSTVPYGKVHGGSDTIYLSAVDGEGNACSFIYSIYSNFGSGMVVPGTGIVLHTGVRSSHWSPATPTPWPAGSGLTTPSFPGWPPRTTNSSCATESWARSCNPRATCKSSATVVDHGMDPKRPLNALRFIVTEEDVALEEGIPAEVLENLTNRGHNTRTISGYYRGMTGGLGGAQLIQRDPESGVLRGASEPRKDGCAVGW